MAEKNDSNQLLVDARGVSMDFNAFTERTDDLKEVVVKLFRGKLKKQKFHCLTDLTFQIRYGESVAFIGRNGAGQKHAFENYRGHVAADARQNRRVRQNHAAVTVGRGVRRKRQRHGEYLPQRRHHGLYQKADRK